MAVAVVLCFFQAKCVIFTTKIKEFTRSKQRKTKIENPKNKQLAMENKRLVYAIHTWALNVFYRVEFY
jgi:nitrate/nitrite transporter NarK